MKKQFDRNRIRYKAKRNKGLNFPKAFSKPKDIPLDGFFLRCYIGKALPPLEPQDYED